MIHKLSTAYLILILIVFSVDTFAKEKTILNIAAYHKGYRWTDDCILGIDSSLQEKYRMITHYMNTKRLPEEFHTEAVEKAMAVYYKTKPDLVMLGDDNALAYLGPVLAKTSTPVVFYGINANPRKYFEENRVPGNITGVLERAPINTIVRILKPLLSTSENILLLFDESPTSDAIIETMLNQKKYISVSGVSFHQQTVVSFEDWCKEIKSAGKKYNAIYLATFYTLKDQSGNTMNPNDILKWTSQNTPVPIFGSSELMVNDSGAVGAFVIVGEVHGRIAGEISDSILQGGKIPFFKMHKKTELLFNQKQLDRFKITLPENLRKISTIN